MDVKSQRPEDLAIALLSRSLCAVQVAAVLADSHGVLGWGWNSSGRDGMGQHAEAHAIGRVNRKRLSKATLYVAAQRKQSGNPVIARPCEDCQKRIRMVKDVIWRDRDGLWRQG